MSDLQRSFVKAQLSKLPAEPITIFDEREEEEGEEEKYEEEEEGGGSSRDVLGPPSTSSTDSSASIESTATVTISPSKELFERPSANTVRGRFAPLPWEDFFDQDLYFDQQTANGLVKHHVYVKPPVGTGPLIVTHHGAGSSGLSFALFTSEIQKLIRNAGVLSLDARHHGETTIDTSSLESPEILDLSLGTLAADLAFIVEATKSKLQWSQLPDIVLLGHSLGGAVVTEVAHKRLLGNAVIGYGVLDVVEGSAIDALQSMEAYLSTRPRSFPSLTSGIEWHIRSRTIRNSASAKVSVPSLLQEQSSAQWTWRTDLSATKPFWEQWFVGLSRKFLDSRGGKLLILAGTDRLDKELMIGQMQGKYQLQVFPEAGHFVHEDSPAKTANIVADFYRRNDRSALVLPPKVDDLIRQGKLKPRT